MIVIYLHTSFKSCGPTNQLCTLLTPQRQTYKYVFCFRPPFKPLRPLPYNVESISLRRLVGFLFLKNDNLVIHSSGILPDILNSLLSLLGRARHFSTIRNVPWQDYSAAFPALSAKLLTLLHIKVFAYSKVTPVACSYTVYSEIKDVITTCEEYIDNAFTGFLDYSVNNMPAARTKVTSPHLRLLSLCPLIPRKRVDLLLRLLLKVKVPFTLDVYGGGPDLDLIREYSKSMPVSVHGFVNRDIVAFSNYDALISLSESEGLSNSIIEALYHGLPCILSPIPSHHYLRTISDNVILLKGLSSEDLNAALHEIKNNCRSQSSTNKVRKYFSPARMLSEYYAIYKRGML